MGIITALLSHIVSKSVMNHNAGEGDRIKITYTKSGGSEITVFEYEVDTGKIVNFSFELNERTQ